MIVTITGCSKTGFKSSEIALNSNEWRKDAFIENRR
jgi:hypothetical protein